MSLSLSVHDHDHVNHWAPHHHHICSLSLLAAASNWVRRLFKSASFFTDCVVFSVGKALRSSSSQHQICASFFKKQCVVFSKHRPSVNSILNQLLRAYEYWSWILESWQCFPQCWHKRIYCNTSSSGCVILNFVNPKIVKNVTFLDSWDRPNFDRL